MMADKDAAPHRRCLAHVMDADLDFSRSGKFLVRWSTSGGGD